MLLVLALKPFEQKNLKLKTSSLLLHVKSYGLWLGHYFPYGRSWLQHSISLKIDFEINLIIFLLQNILKTKVGMEIEIIGTNSELLNN
jgi:hypothetical protein